jgi:hypothetical protein
VRDHPLLGPLLVLAGGVALLVTSLMTWYAIDLAQIPVGERFAQLYARQNDLALTANAWEPRGAGADLLLLALIAAVITLAVVGIVTRGADVRAALGALAAGALATVLSVLWLLSKPRPADIIELRPGAWLGLLSSLLVLGGAFLWWDRVQHPAPVRAAGR